MLRKRKYFVSFLTSYNYIYIYIHGIYNMTRGRTFEADRDMRKRRYSIE